MRLKLLSFLCLIGFLSTNLFAQLDPQFTQYMHNKISYNPAVSGSGDYVDFTFLHRSQWVGIDGAPSTQFFGAHGPVDAISGGVGLYIINDAAGAAASTSAMLNYAYKININSAVLSIGASAGIYQKRLDGSKLITPNGNYEGSVQHNDDILPHTKVNGMTPDFGLGVFYNHQRFFTGISTTHLSALTVGMEDEGRVLDFNLSRNYYFTGGWKFYINNITLQPSVLVKSDFTGLQSDFNFLADFNSNFWTGITYRGYNSNSFDAVGIIAGLRIAGNFGLTYSFDFPLSDIGRETLGSHEVGLNYKFDLKPKDPKGKIIYNPRFL